MLEQDSPPLAFESFEWMNRHFCNVRDEWRTHVISHALICHGYGEKKKADGFVSKQTWRG